ncbi:MAG: haloalkane dehalogenase [Gammaproteobacteria bacterium]|nr:haloalkane dehalogenase [Gammaproteobacteria bacterium]
MSTEPSTFADKKFIEVLQHRMACIDLPAEQASADTLVFLHGNPTSSYLWRNIMPLCRSLGRCVAPDLIGMGDSDKLENSNAESYRFEQHREFLDALLDKLDIGDSVILVVHDWGSALGFDWARRHSERVKGIVYMEAVVRPLLWSEWPENARGVFQGMRSTKGEQMVLEKNIFVERILPASIMRDLSDEEHAEYRRPFAEPGEIRRPTLSWPREIPIEGEPPNVVAIVQAYADWLETAAVDKLFINAEPGSILTGAQRDYCRSWPHQREVTVAGTHFIQEDSPDAIGAAISEFVQSLDNR